MPIAQFANPYYQSVYEAGMARLNENTRQKRAMASNAAGTAGVNSSGLGQLPQGEISRGAVMAESELGSDVAGMEEAERRADQRFAQQKELLSMQAAMQEAIRDRALNRERAQLRADKSSAIIGGAISGIGNAAVNRFGGGK